mmetsp:Transcript_5120/g.12408  ORF Transcript_5120/g.12408 Transcript_5120/m.12408 type:complete len:605 (-) Transcript_5120:122-1936(-)
MKPEDFGSDSSGPVDLYLSEEDPEYSKRRIKAVKRDSTSDPEAVSDGDIWSLQQEMEKATVKSQTPVETEEGEGPQEYTVEMIEDRLRFEGIKPPSNALLRRVPANERYRFLSVLPFERRQKEKNKCGNSSHVKNKENENERGAHSARQSPTPFDIPGTSESGLQCPSKATSIILDPNEGDNVPKLPRRPFRKKLDEVIQGMKERNKAEKKKYQQRRKLVLREQEDANFKTLGKKGNATLEIKQEEKEADLNPAEDEYVNKMEEELEILDKKLQELKIRNVTSMADWNQKKEKVQVVEMEYKLLSETYKYERAKLTMKSISRNRDEHARMERNQRKAEGVNYGECEVYHDGKFMTFDELKNQSGIVTKHENASTSNSRVPGYIPPEWEAAGHVNDIDETELAKVAEEIKDQEEERRNKWKQLGFMGEMFDIDSPALMFRKSEKINPKQMGRWAVVFERLDVWLCTRTIEYLGGETLPSLPELDEESLESREWILGIVENQVMRVLPHLMHKLNITHEAEDLENSVKETIANFFVRGSENAVPAMDAGQWKLLTLALMKAQERIRVPSIRSVFDLNDLTVKKNLERILKDYDFSIDEFEEIFTLF